MLGLVAASAKDKIEKGGIGEGRSNDLGGKLTGLQGLLSSFDPRDSSGDSSSEITKG